MNLQQKKIIQKVSDDVKSILEGEGSGHDWWHIVRVWNIAKHIGCGEMADMFTVELAALLHDIADWKFHDGDSTVGPKKARQILEKYSAPTETINMVCDIIANLSFKGAGVKSEMKTIEGEVVQDSDRLDAIGAIGIARAFAYSGHKNWQMYDPDKKPSLHQSKEDYLNSESPAINHFYEKLLLLKDRMNTKTAKKLAEGRHRVMEEYLDNFFREWEGEI
jgi:uncharacterized protein